jgi:hypothetical protein
MAITLNNVTSGYNLSVINSNFQNIQEYINAVLLARASTGVAGEGKMERDLDMDGYRILNADIDGSSLTNDKAIRVPPYEPALDPLPAAALRKGKVLTFDITTGLPSVVAPASGSAVDVLNQLALPTGAGLVGTTQGITVQASINNLNNKTSHLFVNVRDLGAVGNGVANDTAAFNAAIAAVPNGGTIYVPAGVYMVASTLDVKLKKMHWLGDGFNQSIIRASAVMATQLDAFQATVDYGFNEFTMSNIQWDGNNLAQVNFRIKNRNYCKFTSCAFFNTTSYGVQAESNISNSWDMCSFGNSPVPLALLGSNHRNSFRSCTFVGATNTFIQLLDGVDGNSAVQFSNCDIEYQNGTLEVTGVYARVAGSVSFNDCYIGEGIRGTILYLEGSGSLNMRGGLMVFGEYNLTNSTMTRVAGNGEIVFTSVDINGGTYADMARLGNAFGTRISYRRCKFNFPTLGNNAIAGGGVGSGNAPQIVPFYGRGWNFNANGGTGQRDFAGTDQKITVFGTASTMSIYSAIDASKLSVGLGASGRYSYLVITYQSDVAFSARFTSTNLGAPVTDLGTLPAYPSGYITYIVPCDISSAATILEFDFPATSTGTKFTLRDCTILDASYATNATGTLMNLHKAV